MYQGTLPQVSDRASSDLTVEVINDDTDENMDLSDATDVVLEIREQRSSRPALSASLMGGTVTNIDTGIVQARFTEAQMRTLCAGTYDVGLVVKLPDETIQLLIGSLPVLDGVVR